MASSCSCKYQCEQSGAQQKDILGRKKTTTGWKHFAEERFLFQKDKPMCTASDHQPLNAAPSAASSPSLLLLLAIQKFLIGGLNFPNNNPDLTSVRRWRRWRACTSRIHSWETHPAWSLRSQKLPSTLAVWGESSPSMRLMHTQQLYVHLHCVVKCRLWTLPVWAHFLLCSRHGCQKQLEERTLPMSSTIMLNMCKKDLSLLKTNGWQDL